MEEKEIPENPEEDEKAHKESEVIEEIEAFVCPSCGAEVADDTVTCPGCGAFFDYENETSDMDREVLQPEPSGIEEEIPPPSMDSGDAAETPEKSESEVRIEGALRDYSAKRRKRYLSGALFTGLGIIFFVLLWLYTVHRVWVEDADTVFGLEVILLLVIASVLFILGMYLILTYPRSSLTDVFASMSRAEPK